MSYDYAALIDENMDILMEFPFEWNGVTVRITPKLVDQIIRNWGGLSSRPAVRLIKSRFDRYAKCHRERSVYESNDRNDDQIQAAFVQLAEAVDDIEFWNAIQGRI